MSYQIVRTDDEINEVLNKAAKVEERGKGSVRMYGHAQGVQAALHWLIGDWDDNPMDE